MAQHEMLGPVEPRTWLMGTEAFERVMSHHGGIRALWETKWRVPCLKSVYPFHDGKFEDFEPMFEHLIENNINDGTSTAYTTAFLPPAKNLTTRADTLALSNPEEAAAALYLRAACLLRIARFPYITLFPEVNCPVKWQAWELQKEVYLKAGALFECPVEEVLVPHVYKAGRDRGVIPIYFRAPRDDDNKGGGEKRGGEDKGKGKEREGEEKRKWPVVILMTGLDSYRPDNTLRTTEFLSRNWASVTVEIPGTADCPSDPSDPSSPDRLWDSLLSWMERDGRFDMGRVMVWGLSAGGYYAVRIAHTHWERLVGVVAQGAGCHHFFGKKWLERVGGHEYPFKLTPALAMKYGYDSVEEYVKGAQKKFSLLETGVLDGPSARLLLINGTMDGLMPIEDSMLLLEHGTPKEARFFSGALQMGYPMANAAVYPWMEGVMASAK